MSVVKVQTPSGHYTIAIAANIIDQLGTSIPNDTSAIILVSNPKIMELYGKRAIESLKAAGKTILQYEIPDGEIYKDFETLYGLHTFMLQHKLDRKAVLVALGGGVVGDLCGFAAATFMRGIRFVQVPTTLLAQVDSSVGGKTAVNHPLGKNMIGAFHQPIAVDIDINVLKSLDKREISAGLAEVIKYGLILDAEFFEWCEAHADELKALDPKAISYAVHRSCELKAEVVSKDEKEAGLREILNLGHTFGHAIEAGLGYGKWLHGEAVGCGIIQATELSVLVSNFPKDDVQRVRDLIRRIGCPTVAPNLGKSKWIELMKADKKAINNKIRFVVLNKIGEAKLVGAPMEYVGLVLDRTVKVETEVEVENE